MQRARPPHSESQMHWLPACGTQTPLWHVLPVPQLLAHCDRHWPPMQLLPAPQSAEEEHCDHSSTPQLACAML